MQLLKKDLTVNVCPYCASAKLEEQVGEYRCLGCGKSFPWSEALVHTPRTQGVCDIPGRPMTAQEVVTGMAKDLMEGIYKNVARVMGCVLIETGFCGAADTEALARLIREGCMGAYQGIILEMEKIASERQAKNGKPS